MEKAVYFFAGVSTSLFTALVTPRVDTAELVQLRHTLRGVQDALVSHTCFEAPVERSSGLGYCALLLGLTLCIVGGASVYLHGLLQLARSVGPKEVAGLTATPRRAKGPAGPPLQSLAQ